MSTYKRKEGYEGDFHQDAEPLLTKKAWLETATNLSTAAQLENFIDFFAKPEVEALMALLSKLQLRSDLNFFLLDLTDLGRKRKEGLDKAAWQAFPYEPTDIKFLSQALSSLVAFFERNIPFSLTEVNGRFTKLVAGILNAFPELSGMGNNQELVRKIVTQLQTEPKLVNRLMSLIMTHEPHQWLSELTADEIKIFEQVINQEIVAWIDYEGGLRETFKNWIKVFANWLLERIAQGKLHVVNRNGVEVNAGSLEGEVRDLFRKRPLMSLSVRQEVPEEWLVLREERHKATSTTTRLAQFMDDFNHQAFVTFFLEDLEKGAVFQEPVVNYYRQFLQTVETLKNHLSNYRGDALSWEIDTSTELPEFNKLLEKLGKQLIFAYSGYIKQLTEKQGSHETAVGGPHTLAYLFRCLELDFSPMYPKFFARHISKHLNYAVKILDTLQFEDMNRQEEWQAWYRDFRPELVTLSTTIREEFPTEEYLAEKRKRLESGQGDQELGDELRDTTDPFENNSLTSNHS